MKFLKILVLLVVNTYITNYFFLRFEKADYSIAIQGLNNFSEDLSDIGFSVDSLSYFGFSIFIGVILTLLLTIFIDTDNIFKNVLSIVYLPINLFLINIGTLLSILYLFRFYNFPRSELIFNLIFYPVAVSFLLFLLNLDLQDKFLKFKYKKNVINIILIISFLVFGVLVYIQIQSSRLIAEIDNTKIEENPSVEFKITEDLISGEVVCSKWSGSSNFQNCLGGVSLTQVGEFDSKITNIYSSDDYYLKVFSTGVILDEFNEVYLDISSKVSTKFAESGLYDIEFHPKEDYFLLSYSNLNNDLIVEKYNSKNLSLIEEVLTVPNPNSSHFCGSLEWSNYYNDFLLCVGDMGDKNSAIDTTSQKGKILLLNSKNNKDFPLISESKIQNQLENIVAYGLRNPWNFKEYGNLLVIPDVGNKSNEELNVINYDEIALDEQLLFGWPLFEGSILNPVDIFGLKLWSSNNSLSDFLNSNSISPVVFYDRPAPENNRIAIIGTLIYKNSNSDYFNHFIFADYLSKELFLYDYKNDYLYILPLPPFPGFLTAIGQHPKDNSKIVFSTVDNNGSSLYEVNLP